MKTLRFILVVGIVILGGFGCSNSINSSHQEAMYLIEHQPDFQEFLQGFEVRNTPLGLPDDSFISKTFPDLQVKDNRFVRIMVYRTKTQTIKVVFLKDSRPPEIIVAKEFR